MEPLCYAGRLLFWGLVETSGFCIPRLTSADHFKWPAPLYVCAEIFRFFISLSDYLLHPVGLNNCDFFLFVDWV
jgi:hypothetical protein